ncbi:MAG: hypothetical protein HZB26_09730 [Candidatus Hydrogenedentes bacterium]|nr:hypothetical protein [Candidatus Hydrogenedentota bacterium]
MELHKALGLAALLILVLVAKIGCIGFGLWYEATYPGARDRMLAVYQTRRRKCLIVGAVNAIVGALLIVFLVATKVLGLVGILLAGTLIAFVVIGYGVGYRDLGARLASPAPETPWRTTLLGGLVAEAAFLAPIAGQVLALIMLFRGLGAVIITLMARKTILPQPETQSPQD